MYRRVVTPPWRKPSTARPDLAAEIARGAAARTAASAISAERLPRLDLEADYGLSGVRMPDAITTASRGPGDAADSGRVPA